MKLTDDFLKEFRLLLNSVERCYLFDDSPVINGEIEFDKYEILYEEYSSEIKFLFGRLHYFIFDCLTAIKQRIDEQSNYYVRNLVKSRFLSLCNTIKLFDNFFKEKNLHFSIREDCAALIKDLYKYINKTDNNMLPENFVIPDIKLYQPLFTLRNTNDFSKIQYLIFGNSKTKPDIIVRNVFDGDLSILNKDKLFVYDKIVNDSILYKDFNKWQKDNIEILKNYKIEENLGVIEQKFFKYYKQNYFNENHPVLIPQVYLHYDPKTIEERKESLYQNGFYRQRIDFMMVYKGKRIIIEIDGKEHYSDENGNVDLKKYSIQTHYDREMKFLGYDIFRFGGKELGESFDKVLKEFFDNLYKYLDIELDKG